MWKPSLCDCGQATSTTLPQFPHLLKRGQSWQPSPPHWWQAGDDITEMRSLGSEDALWRRGPPGPKPSLLALAPPHLAGWVWRHSIQSSWTQGHVWNVCPSARGVVRLKRDCLTGTVTGWTTRVEVSLWNVPQSTLNSLLPVAGNLQGIFFFFCHLTVTKFTFKFCKLEISS